MNKKLKIMHVAWSLDNGGVEELLYITAKYNPKDKYDLNFISCDRSPGEIGQKIKNLGYQVSALNVSSRILDVRMLFGLCKAIKQFKPDIVQIYTKVNVLGRIAAKVTGVKIIICNEVDLDGSGPDIGMKLVAWLKRKLEFLSDKIVSCSNTVRNHWDRNNTGKHHVIFLPVDIEKVGNPQIATDHKLFKNGNYPVIGMVSRICPGKGHEYLIRALPDILDEFPAVKVKIVGKGPLLDDLKRLAQEINVANSIVFTGYVQDIYKELNSLDVFILPSLSEGFPISILEAMAAGLPVVASNVGGIPEAVEDGVTGFLFKAKNTKELASAVKRMLSDRAQAVKMGSAARKKILNEFSPDQYIEKMELLYRTLVVEKAI